MMIKPPGWPFLTAVSAWGCVILYWASVPHWYVIEMFLFTFFVGGLALTLTWVARFATAARRGELSGHLRRWFLPWLIPAIVALALATDASFWLRFTLSEPSMRAFAQTVTAETAREESCRWLGLYRVCWAAPYSTLDAVDVPGSAALATEEWAIESNTGFVWLPKGQPEGTYDDFYRHLKDHWYGWHGWDSW